MQTTKQQILQILQETGNDWKPQLEEAARECGFLIQNIPTEVIGRFVMRFQAAQIGGVISPICPSDFQ